MRPMLRAAVAVAGLLGVGVALTGCGGTTHETRSAKPSAGHSADVTWLTNVDACLDAARQLIALGVGDSRGLIYVDDNGNEVSGSHYVGDDGEMHQSHMQDTGPDTTEQEDSVLGPDPGGFSPDSFARLHMSSVVAQLRGNSDLTLARESCQTVVNTAAGSPPAPSEGASLPSPDGPDPSEVALDAKADVWATCQDKVIKLLAPYASGEQTEAQVLARTPAKWHTKLSKAFLTARGVSQDLLTEWTYDASFSVCGENPGLVP
jgi:hypothetical protein